MNPVPVITIDGPSGGGKGTLGVWLARELGYHFLDSGLIYRFFGYFADAEQIAGDDDDALRALADRLDGDFVLGDGEVRLHYEGEDITDRLRNEQTAAAASRYSAIPLVRELLLDMQRREREAPGLVADGRDMGTVVFPDAAVKFFVTASPEVRAERRFRQLNDAGRGDTLSRLAKEIAERDRRDASRSVSPLRPADDAQILDTSTMSIDEVRTAAMLAVEERAFVRSPGR